jgi:cytochrome b subunit of formate dehydrogenase
LADGFLSVRAERLQTHTNTNVSFFLSLSSPLSLSLCLSVFPNDESNLYYFTTVFRSGGVCDPKWFTHPFIKTSMRQAGYNKKPEYWKRAIATERERRER